METFVKILGIIVAILLLIAIGFGLSGLIIMLVWNVIAGFFGFKTITFWVAVAISVALSIIGGAFKSTIKKGE